MNIEMGEYIVGAYLKIIKNCGVVDYNVRRPGGRLTGLNELGVMGLDFKNRIAYLCEVTTHLDGLLYGSSNNTTMERIRKKFYHMKEYADDQLSNFFTEKHLMLWSPVVTPKTRVELENINEIELIISEVYTECINEL
jgi:hypothetical protein